MKSGKSGEDDGICAEHFHYASFNLLERLTKLLNSMLTHSYVPRQFRYSHMIPIAKDPNGNLVDISDYRGITIFSMTWH